MITIKPDLIKIKQGDGYVPLLAIKGEQGEQGEPGAVDYGSVYPIGSIYMSVNDTSPASLFGGEWERLEGRFLLGAGEIKEYNKNGTRTDEDGNNYDVFTYNAGSTGGSAYAVVVAHQHYVDVIGGIGRDEITSGYNAILQTGIAQNNNSILTQTRGVDGTGKNMPPYLAVYMWKRTA